MTTNQELIKDIRSSSEKSIRQKMIVEEFSRYRTVLNVIDKGNSGYYLFTTEELDLSEEMER